jgi:hypothetical protein
MNVNVKAITSIILVFVTAVFSLAGCDKEQTQSATEAQTPTTIPVPEKPVTVSEIESQGAKKLDTEEIRHLIVGKMVAIKRLSTGEEITGYYNEDGTRTLVEFEKGVEIQGENTTGATRDPYSIDNGQLHAVLDGKQISTTIYQLGERYLAAISDENGKVNYEVIPPGH